MAKMPAGWREGHDQTVACPHRDLSVCSPCQVEHEARLVEVYGVHYWTRSASEKKQLQEALA